MVGELGGRVPEEGLAVLDDAVELPDEELIAAAPDHPVFRITVKP